MAGEFGHIPIDPTGPLCGCGQKGCWEMFASSRAALRYYAEAHPDTPALTIQDLLNRAEDGEPKAIEALARQASYLAHGLHFITVALAPELILLTGDITSAWPHFAKDVEAELKRKVLGGVAPRIMLTTDAESARLRGAAVLVLQRHLGLSPVVEPDEEDQTQPEGSGGSEGRWCEEAEGCDEDLCCQRVESQTLFAHGVEGRQRRAARRQWNVLGYCCGLQAGRTCGQGEVDIGLIERVLFGVDQ